MKLEHSKFPAFSNIMVSCNVQETPSPCSAPTAILERERHWNVVVLDDPVNLMTYVVMVFRKLFGFDEATATRHMLQVHEQGRSVLWTGSREKAEAYVQSLQQWCLSAILEPYEDN